MSTLPCRVAVIAERRNEMKTKSRTGREGMKERQLLERYGSQEKVNKLKDILKKKQMFEWDPDFPDDEEDWGGVCIQIF